MSGDLAEKEAQADAICARIADSLEAPLPDDAEEVLLACERSPLISEVLEYASKANMAKKAGDTAAAHHWFDQVILLGDVVLGQIDSQGEGR